MDTDPTVLAEWLAEGAARLAATLREAGPDAPVWTPVPRSPATPTFYARRMAHETAIHRADATPAVGVGYELAGDVAADALDEWLELVTFGWRARGWIAGCAGSPWPAWSARRSSSTTSFSTGWPRAWW